MDVYKENFEMRHKIDEMQNAFGEITSMLYCIGGPLNDNVHRYNKKQRKIFFRIADITKHYERRESD